MLNGSRRSSKAVISHYGPRIGWAAVTGCSCLVVLGSVAYRTTRVWEAQRSAMTEGAGRWAAWTFLLGLAAIGLLVLSVVLLDLTWQSRWAPLPVALAAIPLWAASRIGRSQWDRLLRERGQERDYVLDIAGGLPVVTAMGAWGAGSALLLAGLLWWSARDRRVRPASIDTDARFA